MSSYDIAFESRGNTMTYCALEAEAMSAAVCRHSSQDALLWHLHR